MQSSKEQKGERLESLPRDQCKEIEENNRMGKTRDLFKKIRDSKVTFHAKMGTIHYGEHCGYPLKKLEIELLYDPAIPLLGIHTEETRTERDIFTPVFTAGLFTIARRDKKAFFSDQYK